MYINRASDLKGQIAAQLVWLGQPSKNLLNGTAWIRSECVRSTGRRWFCGRICFFLLTTEQCAEFECSPTVFLPQQKRNGVFVSGGRGVSRTHIVL